MEDEWDPAEQISNFRIDEITHEVKLPPSTYRLADDYAADAATWLDDPESGSSGRYCVRKREESDSIGSWVYSFYFNDAQTAFNFKMRWA